MKPILLKELIDHAWQYSNFYQEFWKQHNFIPERDFRKDDDIKKIPILTKTDFLSKSAKKRSLTNSKDWYYFTAHSGGTTMGKSLVILQSHFAMPPYYHFIQNLLGKSCLTVLMLRPASHIVAFLGAGIPEGYFPRGSVISAGEPNDFELSSRMAHEIGADCLVARPSTAIKFAAALKQRNYPIDRIKFLWLAGEPLTAAALTLLRQIYPRALILHLYAMTEAPCALGMKSSLCSSLDALSPNAYHLDTEDFVFEIDTAGSLIVTALHKIPTPLIRYNTGDKIIIRKDFQCSCGFPKGAVGIVGPRMDYASYKIGGYTFNVDAIKKVLDTLGWPLTSDFRLRIEQIASGGQLSTLLSLSIRPAMQYLPIPTTIIKRALEKKIIVAPGKPLGEATRRGSINLLKITFDPAIKGASIIPPAEIIKPFIAIK